MVLKAFNDQSKNLHFGIAHIIFYLLKTFVSFVLFDEAKKIENFELGYFLQNTFYLTCLFNTIILIFYMQFILQQRQHSEYLALSTNVIVAIFLIYSEALLSRYTDTRLSWKSLTLIGLYFLEAIYSLVTLKLIAPIIDFYLFRKLGVSFAINRAFRIRTALLSFSLPNQILPLMSLITTINSPEPIFRGHTYISVFVNLLSIAINIFVYVQMDDENVMRRKIAFVLIIMKLFTNHFTVVFYLNFPPRDLGYLEQSKFFIDFSLVSSLRRYLNLISFVETAVFGIYLTNDFFCFGSGIKDYLTLKKFKNRISIE